MPVMKGVHLDDILWSKDSAAHDERLELVFHKSQEAAKPMSGRDSGGSSSSSHVSAEEPVFATICHSEPQLSLVEDDTSDYRSSQRLSPAKIKSCLKTTPPESPAGNKSPSGQVQFTLFNASDEECGVEQDSIVAVRSSKDKTSKKGRFKNILRPLRRSQSAGGGKDVPAHALFLRHNMDKSDKQVESSKSSERTSSNESEDDEEEDLSEKDKKSGTNGKKKVKSLAKDMKEKLSFLRRRHTDTALSSKGETKKATPDAIQEWSKGFDNLLYDKCGLEMFRYFLHTEFSEENIEFWIACEEFKNLKSKQIPARAQKIYMDFVAVQAPKEINLDSNTRLQTISGLNNPTRHSFENAQKRIQALMEKDSYPRFLRSDVYLQLLAENKLDT